MKLNKGIEIDVKASLSVDETTAQTCMTLLSIFGKAAGGKGMIIKFNEDGWDPNWVIVNDEQILYKAMYGVDMDEEE